MLVLDLVKTRLGKSVRPLDGIGQPAATRLADILVVVAVSTLVAFLAKAMFGRSAGQPAELAIFSVMVALMLVATNELRRLYMPDRLGTLSGQLWDVTTSWLSVWAFLAILGFAMRASADFSRIAIGAIFIADLVCLLLARAGLYRVYLGGRQRYRRERIALLSIGSSDQLGSVYANSAVVHSATINIDQSVDFDEFVAWARKRDASKVIIAMPPDRLGDALTFVERLRGLPIPIYVATEPWLSDILARPRMVAGAIPAFEIRSAPLSVAERAMKRGLDIVVASTALILLAPLMLVIAAVIRFETPGPTLFRQRRLGFNGREFRILKFRSMTVTEDGEKVVQASKNDKRVTRIGRIIRATSIDELPQLINVLRGDMSLVGPRPHAVAHDNTYEDTIADYSLRRHMKPGLTGWAQVNGLRGETRSIDLMERRVEHDLWYIDNWTIWLDLRILLMTAVELFRNRDVY